MKKVLFSIILLCSVILTGCEQLTELTDHESNVVAEYMAGAVLKHSGYNQTLIYPQTQETLAVETIGSDVKPETSESQNPADAATESQTSTDATTESQIGESGTSEAQTDGIKTMSTINDMINNKDFKVSYTKFGLLNDYTDTKEYFNIEPASGNRLLAVYFTVENISDATKYFNLTNQNLQYTMKMGAGTVYAPMMTLMTGDLQFINVKIGAGKKQEALLIFEVPETIDTSGMTLSISKKDSIAMIEMK